MDGQEPAVQNAPPRLAAAPEARACPGNLPVHLPPLYGRDADAAALKALMAGHRLVSVVGPGGIGKTRLAQAVAHDMQQTNIGGAWLVDLAPITKPELAALTVARALGHPIGPAKAIASLVEAIRGQELLLVLDNCEQLVGAVAELARAIFAGAPGVKLIVTSQEPLRLAEEQVYRLGPLAVPANPNADAATALDHGAIALFVARARAADARFEVDEDNVGATIEICARLDGVALAIELAAARVSLLGVHGVRQRLDERFQLLAGGRREALPRHRALSAALEWSYGLLSDGERHVLDRLGIFVGGFSLEAAQILVANEQIDEWTVLEHLSTLVDKSLVITGSRRAAALSAFGNQPGLRAAAARGDGHDEGDSPQACIGADCDVAIAGLQEIAGTARGELRGGHRQYSRRVSLGGGGRRRSRNRHRVGGTSSA